MPENRIELKSLISFPNLFMFEEWLFAKTDMQILHPDRIINNIYFETDTHKSIADNLHGFSKRTKVRLRWYGNSYCENSLNAYLEFKRKRNIVGWKETYNIKLKKLNSYSYDELIKNINNFLPLKSKVEFSYYSFPFILNSYLRKYYFSKDTKIRMTVDNSIRAYDQRWNTHINKNIKIFLPDTIVVEFKFEVNSKKKAINLLKNFPFRISKHSKYITSILHV